MILNFLASVRLSALIIGFIAVTAIAETAPEFRAERLEGGKFLLSGALGEKILLLHFWDSCCSGCREALPAVDSIAKIYPENVKVIAVSTDSPKSQSKVKPFLKTNGYAFDVILDPNMEIRKLFGGTETPFTVIILPSGEIAFKKTGAAPDEVGILKSALDPLLKSNNNH